MVGLAGGPISFGAYLIEKDSISVDQTRMNCLPVATALAEFNPGIYWG